MEYEKYYDKRSNGSYIVHFPNNKGQSLKELNEMFSVFGKVLSIDNRGHLYGLCFVRYEKVEDAIRCIDGFRNHNYIKILPHKNKSKGFTVKKMASNRNNEIFNHSSPKSDLRSDNFETNDSCNKQFRDDRKNRLSNFNDNTIDTDYFSDTSFTNFRRSINGNRYSTKSISSLTHLFKVKSLQRAASSTSISSGSTVDSSRKCEEIFDETEIPSLVPLDKKYKKHNIRFSSPSQKIIPAQEVIVANIHPNLSIHYMLHLFEKYNPISISLMMTTPTNGIRYCHVYYKTCEEAYATMKEFDTYYLHGKSLIVLTSQKLMEEIC